MEGLYTWPARAEVMDHGYLAYVWPPPVNFLLYWHQMKEAVKQNAHVESYVHP